MYPWLFTTSVFKGATIMAALLLILIATMSQLTFYSHAHNACFALCFRSNYLQKKLRNVNFTDGTNKTAREMGNTNQTERIVEKKTVLIK